MNRSASTKFGITSICTDAGIPSVWNVAAASHADGAVTASLAVIENCVSGRKLASLPTSVMSVPCRVVTSLGTAASAWRSPASTAHARYALAAWGSA